jgi:hypothetical protein
LNKYIVFPLLFIAFLTFFTEAGAQMITGVWHGKINRQKVEVKIILNGDSLTGTSYYYENASNFRRYSIRGFFDQNTNEAVWWDDRLIEEKSGRFNLSSPGKMPLLSRADFNCPGGSKMMLDGKAADKEEETRTKGDVHLDKSGTAIFQDEWDYVIENFLVGGNDPELINGIAAIDRTIAVIDEKKEEPLQKPAVVTPEPVRTMPPALPVVVEKEASISEKFEKRKKEFIKEIPVSGDSIELRFYDNAEIDGDSISLFLNGRLLYEHIRLTGNAYIIKLPVADLSDSNELIMVAENMGAIPPNTSYMVAIVEGKRHDAYLASTEGSSAMIRFVKVLK